MKIKMASQKLTRRAFLKKSVAAVAGTLAAGPLISTGCAPQAPTPVPPTPTTVKPKELVLVIQAFAHDAIKPVLDAWEDKTGHKVRLESGPATGMEMVTQYTPDFSAGTSPVDVFSNTDDSAPAFMHAGWLEPLDDVIPQETWDDFPEGFQPHIETWHSYEGKKYRVPHEFAIGYFWRRKDWFDEKNLKSPQTWDEFVSIGKEFTEDEVWGTLEALLKPGLMYVYLAYITAQTGGKIFEFDEATATAFQFVYDLIYTHKIMPETTMSQDYGMINDEYMQDRVAMMRQWPYFWSVTRENEAWYREGKAEIALPPAGPAGSRSWWGGWGFSVPKFAPHKEEALHLIRWITSNENALILAQGQSWFLMPRKSIMAVMGEQGLAVYMNQYVKAGVPAPRPFHPKIAKAQTVVDDVGSLYLTRQISLAEAMRMGKERIAALD